MARLLAICDAGTPSGFSRVSGALLPRFAAAGWDTAVLGIDYYGYPSPLQQQYRMYPAWPGGDHLGVGSVARIIQCEQPDLIFVLQDAHIVSAYLEEIPEEYRGRVVAYVPVDGVGMRPEKVLPLNQCGAIVAYTEFGATELRAAGVDARRITIAPHGIDLEVFRPGDQVAARWACQMPPGPFVVLAANRNQPRKALWLAMQAFALFREQTGADAHLVYHGDVEDTAGGPLVHWAQLFGIRDRFHWNETYKAAAGVDDAQLVQLYRAADAQITTTRGEGWGLTTMEGMACGTAQVIPEWGALAEWAGPAAALARVRPEWHPHETVQLGALGKDVSVADCARQLAELWRDPGRRGELGEAGRQLVSDPRFSWDAVAQQFLAVFDRVAGRSESATYAVEREAAHV